MEDGTSVSVSTVVFLQLVGQRCQVPLVGGIKIYFQCSTCLKPELMKTVLGRLES